MRGVGETALVCWAAPSLQARYELVMRFVPAVRGDRGLETFQCRSASNSYHLQPARTSAKASGGTLRCAPPDLAPRPHNLRGWSTLRCRSWSMPGPSGADAHVRLACPERGADE